MKSEKKKIKKSPSSEETQLAKRLGISAFEAGEKRSPNSDKALAELISFLNLQKLKNEMMKAWLMGWDESNLKPVVIIPVNEPDDSAAYEALKKRNIFIDDKLKLYPPDRITKLKKLIGEHLETCNPANTPTICQMKSEKGGVEKLENEIIERIIKNGLTVSDAIMQIESEFNPNMD